MQGIALFPLENEEAGPPASHPIDEDLSLGTPALIAQAAQPGGVGWILEEDCAAFAGGELLVGVKAEDRKVAEAAGPARL